MNILTITFALCFLAVASAQSGNPLNALYVPVGPSPNPQPVSSAQLARGFDLVDEMVGRWQVLDAACSANAPFALLYLNITNNSIIAIQNNYFNNGDRLIDFILTFARRYLNAFDQYKSSGYVPTGAWNEAFKYAASGRSSVLENLNQGINAHINFDLGIIVYNLTYTSASDADDYNRVNDILFDLAVPANAGVAYRYDPTGTLANPAIVASTPVVVDVLVAARAGAYTNGLGLLAQSSQSGRDAQVAAINVLTTVAAVTAEGNRLGLLGSTAAARTAYCQAHRF